MASREELAETVSSACEMMNKLAATAHAGIRLAKYVRDNNEDAVANEMAEEIIRLARIVEAHTPTYTER